MTGPERAERVLKSAMAGLQGEALDLLAPLLEYDEQHNGDLVRTLTTYLSLSGNASATAEAMFLHRSGFLYRLRRIEALLGIDLNELEHRTAVQIAIIGLDRQRRQ